MKGRQENQKRSQIKITEHAKQRLAERVPEIHPKNYANFVSGARYNGQTINELYGANPEFAKMIQNRFHSGNNEIRVYKNLVFIFAKNRGSNTVLRTVVDI